jgi:hypothetical protein
MALDVVFWQAFVQEKIRKLPRAVEAYLAVGPRKADHDPAFQKTLEVYCDVVPRSAELADEPDHVPDAPREGERIHQRPEPRFPAGDQQTVDERMAFEDARGCLFDNPGDFTSGMDFLERFKSGQGLRHIADGGKFYDKNFHCRLVP